MTFITRILLLTLFFTRFCQAQTVWQGRVLNGKDQQPIQSAVVTLSHVANGDTLPVAFASTDALGQFRLTRAGIDLPSHCLQARAFGFGVQTVILAGVTGPLTFVLPEKPLALNEVRVRGQVPVFEKKDSTVYAAKAFADGTERSVEDLLRKLPGVLVGADGKISVNGKPVDKVMIEGEDVFSKNYRLVTRTLAASLLDKVEVVDNYTESPLLKGIERSGKTVINLTVGDKAKLRVFGNGELAPGTRERYLAAVTLFSLKGRTKTGVVLNANNLGIDPAGAFTYTPNTEPSVQQLLGLPGAAEQVGRVLPPSLQSVEADRYLYRQAAMPGLSLSRKWGSRVRANGYLYGTEGNARQQNLTDYRYTLEGGDFRSRDSTAYAQILRQWAGRAQVDVPLGARTSLRLVANGLIDQSGLNTTARSQTPNRSDTALIDNGLSSVRGTYSVQLIRRLGPKQAIQVDALYEHLRYDRDFSARSSRYASLLSTTTGPVLTGIQQPLAGGQQSRYMAGKWLYKTDSSRWGAYHAEIALTYCRQTERLTTTFSRDPAMPGSDSATVLFSNRATYTTDLLRLHAQWSGQWRKFTIMAQTIGQWTRADLGTNVLAYNGLHERLWLSPMLRLGWNLAPRQTLTLTYRQNPTLPSLPNLLPGYIFGDYRSASRGSVGWLPSIGQSVLVSYSLKDWTHWFTLFGSVGVFRQQQLYTYQTEANPLFSLTTRQPFEGHTDMLMASGQFEKLLTVIDSKLKIDINYSQTQQIAGINRLGLQRNSAQTLRTDVYLFSTSTKALILPELRWSQTISQTNLPGQSQMQRLFQPSVALRLRPTQRFMARVGAEYMHWQTGSNRATGVFLDGEVSYNPAGSDWSFSAKARNLLNAPQLAFTYFEAFLTTQQLYTLQPGFVSVNVQRRVLIVWISVANKLIINTYCQRFPKNSFMNRFTSHWLTTGWRV